MRLVLRALKVVLINLLIGVALLLVPIELYSGTWLSGQGAIAKFDAGPNTDEKLAIPSYPPGTTITFRRDQYGFRGGPANPADINVLAIGDSTTIERYNDENDTWTAVLQRLLREEGCAMTIANAGIDGYGTAGNTASFDGWFDQVPGLKPRFIIDYVGINDAIGDPTKVNFINSERYPGLWRQFQHYVAAHSALRRFYVTLRRNLQARKAGLPYGATPPPRTLSWETASLPPDFATVIALKVERYRQRLTELDRVIRKFGSRPIYITQQRADGRLVDGQWQQLSGSHGARDAATLAAINATTLAFCRDTGETCIDLAGELDLQADEFGDSIHTTPAGSAHIARFLTAALRPIFCPKVER
jgi:lysophospholipase L1-like esterase